MPHITDSTSARAAEMWACLILAVSFVALRAWMFTHATPIEFPDSASYFSKASEQMWTRDFFFGSGRFFVVPLAYKLVGAVHSLESSALTWFQWLVSITSWLYLAFTVRGTLSCTKSRTIGFAAILVLGLSTDLAMWDRAILSESLSTSGFVLLVAALLRSGQTLAARHVASFVLLAIVWSFTREANSLLLPPLALSLMVTALWYTPRGHRARRYAAIALAACLLVVATTTFVSARGDRWVFPLYNVFGKRVLVSPERVAYYAERGMPLTHRLLAMAGEFADGQDLAFYRAPELESFRTWVQRDGRRVYARDLLSHPVRSVLEPLEDSTEFVDPPIDGYGAPGTVRVVPDLSRWFVREVLGARACLVASLAIGVALAQAARRRRMAIAPLTGLKLVALSAMLLGWLPWVWFTWHAIGKMEVGRHVLAGVTMFRVAVVLLLVYGLEFALTRTQEPA